MRILLKKQGILPPLLAYIAINLLFITKYASRISDVLAIVACLVYSIVAFAAFAQIERKDIFQNKKGLLVSSLVAIALLIALQSSINPYELKIDRWSAIHHFIQSLFQGSYPYGAETHLHGYGSPFPVWQIFHVPFYLLGNVGLSFSVVTLLFIHSAYLQWGSKGGYLSLLLLIASPAYLYEVVTRSDMMTNFLLVGSVVNYLVYFKITLKSHLIAIAILCGLTASTRLTAILPLFMLYFQEFTQVSWQRKISFLLIVVITFAVTFLPFWIWDANTLLYSDHGPFALQTSQIRDFDLIVFLVISVWLACKWKAKYVKLYAYTAVLLGFMVAYTFIFNMATRGDWLRLFSSTYDITYFNMALVFVIATLSALTESEKKIEREK